MLSVDASLTSFFILPLTVFVLMEPLTHPSITINIVGKPLCDHASDLGSTASGGHTNRSFYLLALQGQLSLLYFHCQ